MWTERDNSGVEPNSAPAQRRDGQSPAAEVETAESGSPETGLRQRLAAAWKIIRPYWKSEDRWAGLGLLFLVISLSLGMVYLNVLFNRWNNTFYTALENKDRAVFLEQLVYACWLVAIYIVFAVYQLYLNQMLQIRWRQWLTERYLRNWLANSAYYRMQLLARETDNPDQRIAEDVSLLISGTLSLLVGGLGAVVNLIAFVAILWTLSGTLLFPLGSVSIPLPGYMVWVALIYAVGGTWVAHRIGRPLVPLNFEKQRCEADFRFGLVRFRENTEGVALYHGEEDEFCGFRERFSALAANWWRIMLRQKRLTCFTSGYSQAGWIFPYVVAAPRYFQGELTLGGLMQTTGAFSQVQSSLSFFVDWYTQISEWCSVVERLSGFEQALDHVARQARARGGLRLAGDSEASLRLRDVALELPDGRPIVQNVNLAIAPGDRVLLEGGSGSGKSTLVRAIAGIWPFGQGEISKPSGSRFLFLPQKPYLPIGTLASVVNYPMPAGGIEGAALLDALTAVGLRELAGQLDVSGHWSLQLSPGEQQRIAFARALVQKPEWLFLDEATSAIDEKSEAYLYGLIRERLPNTTIFSVGHRSTLGAFHDRRLVLQHNGSGPGSIIELAPAARPLVSGRFVPYAHNGQKRVAARPQHSAGRNGVEPAAIAARAPIDYPIVG